MQCQHHNTAITLAKTLTARDALPYGNQKAENTGNSDFHCDASTSLKPTTDEPQASGRFVNQGLFLLSE